MFRKALHTLAMQLGGTGAMVALGIVLARVLGPGGRGITTYAWIVLGFVLIFGEGPAAAVVSQYARERIRRAPVHAASLRVLALLGGPAFVVLLVLGAVLPAQRVLIAVAFALPFALYAQVAKGLLIAEGRVQTANVVDIIVTGGYAALGALLVLGGTGVPGALGGWVAAYVAAAVVGAVALHRKPARSDAAVEVPVGALTRAQLGFAGKSGFVYAAGYLNLRVDALVVAYVLGPTALGIYTLATGTAELLWKISNALAWSVFGRIAGDDDATIRELLPRITRATVFVELALGAVVFVIGPMLIRAVYGAAFVGAGLPLRVILLGIAAYAVEPMFGYFLLVRERRPMLVLAIQLSSAAVCAVATVLLLPRWGLAGAAAASTLTYLAVVAVKAVLVSRALRVPLAALMVPRRADASSIAMRGLRFIGRRTPNAATHEAAA